LAAAGIDKTTASFEAVNLCLPSDSFAKASAAKLSEGRPKKKLLHLKELFL
jgi:hypothetical protein